MSPPDLEDSSEGGDRGGRTHLDHATQLQAPDPTQVCQLIMVLFQRILFCFTIFLETIIKKNYFYRSNFFILI